MLMKDIKNDLYNKNIVVPQDICLGPPFPCHVGWMCT